MPRYARIKSQTQIYHIMLRGNNREKIFVDEEDKARMACPLDISFAGVLYFNGK
jgi:putative transposase